MPIDVEQKRRDPYYLRALLATTLDVMLRNGAEQTFDGEGQATIRLLRLICDCKEDKTGEHG